MAAQISPDGKYYWDGQRWVPFQPSAAPVAQPAAQPDPRPFVQAVQAPIQQLPPKFSDDGQWWWNGTQWIPASQAPVPAGSASLPVGLPTQASPPQWAAPPASGQQLPTPAVAAGIGAVGLAYQFSGPALWSIIFGAASIAAPLFTSFYFPVMPLIGFLNAVRAFQRGRLAGAIVGVVLNILGGLVSLIASGLIH